MRLPPTRSIGRLIAIALSTAAIVGPLALAGPANAAGPVVRVQAKAFSVPPGANGGATVMCPDDRRALGGGVVQSGNADGLWLRANGPLDSSGITLDTVSGDVPRQFYAAASDFDVAEQQLKVLAICG